MNIYIDCTNTYNSELNTGIQRVVRNLVNHSVAAGKTLEAECVPVVQTPAGYVQISQLHYTFKKRLGFRIRWRLNDYYLRITQWLVNVSPFSRLNRFLTANKHEFGLIKLILLSISPFMWTWRQYIILRPDKATSTNIIKFAKNDILLLPDSFWNYNFIKFILDAKNNGVLIIAIIHDIISISHPHFFNQSLRTKFQSHLQTLYKYTDGFLCNSDYTKRTLIDYFNTQPFSQDWQTKSYESFYLGADLDAIDRTGRIRSAVKKIFLNNFSIYLTVGTIDPRKNQIYLLSVFDMLWREKSSSKLIIVGKIGWLCNDIIAAIRSHSKFGSNLFFIDDATDSELDYCYSHAKALLYPSIIEGFGLPLIEAQKKGLPVFASNIPVFHEVAGASAAYFDNTDPKSLADMLLKYEMTQTFPADGPQNFTWPTWYESTLQMLTKVFKVAQEIESKTKINFRC